ncbi:DUF116 domain-containing protein [Geothrix sp. PMB-07]|uniref:DUF116 domain-containing protein n=1 Tax=Geothrix sp. PMB-07 TaxID=3068640 RepID=UPI0027415211|nr:DUF116 domain-containing protein [Geothrix sp. PMB-07]WLT33512.1 DUF116 domain-containing protein [Geothrix sp. PMB-07]
MKTLRTLPAPGPLPEESGFLFLLVRRGLPIGMALAAFLAAAMHSVGRGWWMLAGVGALAAAWPSFLKGEAFLRNRAAILRQDGLWANAIRPLAKWLGYEDAWILSFCGHNNRRTRESFGTRRARRALILLPHCIQMARCKAGILDDLQACYDCGLCPVGDYMNAALLNRWEGRITNRSHKAYREAREYRPDLIVAVSCTDRLLKGLTKLPEIPSYVIPLALPHGMCVDTDFSVPHLVAAMESLVEPRRPSGEIQPLRKEGIA